MNLSVAITIANDFCHGLAPYCDRIRIAGSIRRKKAEVGDIELVVIPKKASEPDLFGESLIRDPGFAAFLARHRVIKGDIHTGKFIQVQLPEITVDIFTAVPDNFGHIFAIRTGSSDYSHHILANGWVAAGYHSAGGFLRDANENIIPVREEEDLFKMIGIPFLEPEWRI